MLPFFIRWIGAKVTPHLRRQWRGSKAVMPRIANPVSAVRLRAAPPNILVVYVLSTFAGGAFLFHNRLTCPSGEIGRHIGFKIRRFVNNGRTGSIPVSGTIQ